MGARHGQQGKRTRASLTLAAVTSALVVLPLLLSPSYAAAAGPNDTLSIDRVTPDWSLIEGDQEVVIEGSGFTRGSSVWFGSSRATEVTFVDSSHLKAVTPAKSAGRYTLQINTQEGLVRTLPSAVSFVKLPTMSAPAVSNVTADSFDLTLPSKPAGWVKDNAWTIDFVDTVTGESLGGTSCNQDLNSANLWPAGTQTCTMQYSRLVLPDHDYHVVFRVYDWAGHSKNSAPTNVHLPAAPSMPAVTETLLIDEIGVNGFTLMTPDMGSFATRTAMPDNRYQPAVQLLDATGQPIGWFDNSGDFRPLYPCPEEGCLDSTSPQHSIEAKSNTKIGVISADHIKAGTTYKARIQLYDSKYSRSTYGPTTTITTKTFNGFDTQVAALGAPAVSNVTADSFDLVEPTKPANWIKDSYWMVHLMDPVTHETLTNPCWQDYSLAVWPTGSRTCTIQFSRFVLPGRDYDIAFSVNLLAGTQQLSPTTRIHIQAAPSMPAVTETLLIDEIGVNGFTLMTPDMGSFATRTAMPDNRYQPAVQLLDATGQPIGWFDNSGDFRPLYPCPEEGCLDSTSPQHSIEAKSNTKIGVISADHIKAGTTYKARIQLYDSKYSRSTYGPTTTITTKTFNGFDTQVAALGAPAVSNVTADSFDLVEPTKPANWIKDSYWMVHLMDPVTHETLTNPCWQDYSLAVWPTGSRTCTIQFSRFVLPGRDYDIAFSVNLLAGTQQLSPTTRIHIQAAPSMPAVTETLLIDEIGVNGFTLMTPDMGSFATRTAMPDNRYQPAVQLLDATGQPIGWFDNSGDFRPLYPCPEEGCLDSTSPQHSIEAKSNTKIGVISADHIKAGTTYKARIQLYDSKYSRSTYGPTTTITTVTQAPDSPESVSAEIPDLTSANLSWLRPTDTGGAPIQKYEVSVTQTAPSAAAYTLRQQLSSTPQAVTSGTMKYTISPGTGRKVSKSFTSLDSNSAYVFTVVAINKSGRSAAAGIVVDLSTRVMTLKSAIPNITGSARVGTVLSVNPGSWTPGTTLSYQWKRGNTNIGTNSPTYTLTAADMGKRITVVVTGKKSRYRTQSVTSQPTGVVR